MTYIREQVPWADYILIDEQGNRSLSPNAPKEIKAKYDAYQKQIAEANRRGEFIAK